MEDAIDRRHRLQEQVFRYQATKDGRIFIKWKGRVITTLKGEAARELREELEGANAFEEQLLLAKVTGHFKHGNERQQREHHR